MYYFDEERKLFIALSTVNAMWQNSEDEPVFMMFSDGSDTLEVPQSSLSDFMQAAPFFIDASKTLVLNGLNVASIIPPSLLKEEIKRPQINFYSGSSMWSSTINDSDLPSVVRKIAKMQGLTPRG